jgi:hypothetical protein
MVKKKVRFLRMQIQALTKQLLHFKKGEEGLCIHQHPMCYEEVFNKNIDADKCIICNGQFPLLDIIVCNYQHLYHP